MEGLRTYGRLVEQCTEENVSLEESLALDDSGEYWSDHISISRKHFDEVCSMRDEYQSMVKELLKKFQDKVQKENELEIALKCEKQVVEDLRRKENVNAEKLEELTRQLADKDEELIRQLTDRDDEIIKLNEKVSQLTMRNEEVASQMFERIEKKTAFPVETIGTLKAELKALQVKCNNLENMNMKAEEDIAIYRMARDAYEAEVKFLKNKQRAVSSSVNSATSNKPQSKSIKLPNASLEIKRLTEKLELLEESNIEKDNEIAENILENKSLMDDYKMLARAYKLEKKVLEDLIPLQMANKDLTEKFELLEERNFQQENELSEMLLENNELYSDNKILVQGVEVQKKKIQDLKNEVEKEIEEKNKCISELQTLRNTYKDLEETSSLMVDSFNEIFKLLTELEGIVAPKKCFGKIFRKCGKGQLVLKYVQNIEELIRNLFE